MIYVTWRRGLRSLAAICRNQTWPPDSVDSTFLARATEQPGQEDGTRGESTYLLDEEELSIIETIVQWGVKVFKYHNRVVGRMI
jgi:hypothetical protein